VGWADTSAEDDVQTGVAIDPLGCYYEFGRLKLNNNNNTGYCHSNTRCVCSSSCLTGGDKCTSDNSGYCTASSDSCTTVPTCNGIVNTCNCGTNECTAVYTDQRSGKCEHPITTLAECEQAAAFLGWTDTSAIDDGQTGKIYDPLGCYYEGYSLKLNVNRNTGFCSNRRRCACKSTGMFCVDGTCSQYKDNTAYHHGGAGLAGLVPMGAADLKKVYNNLETC